MKLENLHLKALFLVLFIDLLALIYGASTLSISYDEAVLYFDAQNEGSLLNLAHFLAHFGTMLFGQNDFALRMPFVLVHLMSALLLYLFALKFTKTPKDALFSLILFLLLPGTVASALIANEAAIVICLSLLILNAQIYGFKKAFYALLILALFVDGSFAILFLSLFFYALYKKEIPLVVLNLGLFAASVGLYGFDLSGRPRGYFLDTLGVFAACFSPIVFLYYFYIIYRLAFRPNKPLLWFIASTSFLFCLIFSMRQRLYLEDFLPFCVIATPLIIATLMNSYRIRLPNLRLKYTILIQSALIFLVLFYLAIIFNTLLYGLLSDHKKHFVYNYHFAKELAISLKNRGLNEIKTDPQMQLRLKFYGINESKNFKLIRVNHPSSLKARVGVVSEYFIIKRIE